MHLLHRNYNLIQLIEFKTEKEFYLRVRYENLYQINSINKYLLLDFYIYTIIMHTLPQSKRSKSNLLKMDEEQTKLFHIIVKNF